MEDDGEADAATVTIEVHAEWVIEGDVGRRLAQALAAGRFELAEDPRKVHVGRIRAAGVDVAEGDDAVGVALVGVENGFVAAAHHEAFRRHPQGQDDESVYAQLVSATEKLVFVNRRLVSQAPVSQVGVDVDHSAFLKRECLRSCAGGHAIPLAFGAGRSLERDSGQRHRKTMSAWMCHTR